MKLFACILLLASALPAGRAPEGSSRPAPAVRQSKEDRYRVGSMDRLQIEVWKEEDLSGTFEVSSHGVIRYPLLGELDVAGMTTQEIGDLITEKLKAQYLVNPIVAVNVAGYRSQKVYVFGSVKKPGLFFLEEDTSILKVILDAGGPESGTSLTGDIVRLGDNPGRDGQPVETKRVDLAALFTRGDYSQNIRLRNGDIVFVRGAGKESFKNDVVYITGAVKTPGAYTWNEDTTVLNVVLQAGGPTEFASANRTRVIRGQGPEREIFMVRVDDIMKGDKDKNLKLLPGDLITVPESFF